MPVIRSKVSIAIFALAATGNLARFATASEPASSGRRTIDLISPANCILANDRLKNCRFPETAIDAPAQPGSLTPFRTVGKILVTGNCSTDFPVSISLKPDGERPVEASALRGAEVRITARGQRAITQLTVADASPWTSVAGFDGSCRSQLELRLNEPDWDTREQAHEFLESLQLRIDRIRDEHATLSALLSAYSTMLALKTIAEQLDRRLGEQDLARIFQDPAAFAALLDQLRATTSLKLSRDELRAIDRLAEWLEGSSSRSTTVGKSFSDLFGAAERQVIEKLVSSLGDVEKSRTKLERLATEIHELELELAHAAQLAEQAFPQEARP
jgi:hypothetical protein